MNPSKHECETCGRPASVHIMHEVGRPESSRHFCIDCAAIYQTGAMQAERSLNMGAVLICVGLFGLVISLFADWLAFGRSEGFGVWQLTGLAIGLTLVLTGAMVRTLTIGVTGVCVVVLTLLAEWVGFGSAPGFGMQQVAGTIISIAIVGAGVLFGPIFARGRTIQL